MLALFGCMAASAGASVPALRGANTHPFWFDTNTADFDRELDKLRQAGGNVVRIDLAWSSLELSGKGLYSAGYTAKADTFVQHAHDRGIKVVMVMWSTPCWASSAPADLKLDCTGSWWDRGVQRYGPVDPADFADAAAWVAQRWGDRLAALEIWNEPNLSDFLNSADPAAEYAALLRAAYPRVKQAAPGLTVLAPALAFSDGDFLQALYDHGIGGNFDALSIHPYNEWRDPYDPWLPEWREYTYTTGVPWVRDIMVANGDVAKKLWLTELGWTSCAPSGNSRWCVTADQQAQYIPDAFRIIRDRWDYVEAAILYNLRNKGTDAGDRESQFGVLNRDFTPKKSFATFSQALAELGDVTTPETKIDSAPPASTTSTSATFSFSASEAVSRFECRLDAGAWADCASPKSYAGLSLGIHSFEARATDLAGNVDPSPAQYAWTVAAVDLPPTVTLLAPLAGTAFGSRLCVHASAVDDVRVTRVDFLVDGKVVGSDTTGPAYDYIWSVPKKTTYANHTVTAKAYDSAAQSATQTVSVPHTAGNTRCS